MEKVLRSRKWFVSIIIIITRKGCDFFRLSVKEEDIYWIKISLLFLLLRNHNFTILIHDNFCHLNHILLRMKFLRKLLLLHRHIANGKLCHWKKEWNWYRNWHKVFWLIKICSSIRLLHKLGNHILILMRNLLEFSLLLMDWSLQVGKLCNLKWFSSRIKN